MAQRLAAVLPIVVLEKDAIKETLSDTWGKGGHKWSKKLGTATFALLYMLVDSHLRARRSVVAEAAFHHEDGARWLDRMKERYDFNVVEPHCHADLETVLRRHLDRARVERVRVLIGRSGLL